MSFCSSPESSSSSLLKAAQRRRLRVKLYLIYLIWRSIGENYLHCRKKWSTTQMGTQNMLFCSFHGCFFSMISSQQSACSSSGDPPVSNIISLQDVVVCPSYAVRRPRRLIRSGCGSKLRGTGFEFRPCRIFVIDVVHMQCSQLFKGLECACCLWCCVL